MGRTGPEASATPSAPFAPATVPLSVLAQVPVAVSVSDLDTHLTVWNPACERLFGWTAAEVVGRRALELFDVDPGLRDELEASILRSGHWEGIFRARHRDGHA